MSEMEPFDEHEPNWRIMYGIVLAELALLVVLFTIFTRYFD